MLRYLFLFFLLAFTFQVRASHVIGGEITWACAGNGTVFQLTFYRDCNGADINPVSENLNVWYHPTVSTITLNFVSRTDISPTCSPVTGSPSQLSCGTGANGGNGLGAIEKIIYRSDPTILPGIPGANGWVFTYDNFSRSNLITNLLNPSSTGITLSATMFASPFSVAGTCTDNSPQFLQDPYFISCAGENYEFNLHPVDSDLDSLTVQFGSPMNSLTAGPYNPPVNPAPIAFEVGFTAQSPTPDASFNPTNIPAVLNTSSGNLTFTSATIGSYVVKVVTKSFRQGHLIAQVEREMQLFVVNCSGNNNRPVIQAPFAGNLFETTVDAGTLVTFPIQAVDVELLQDGSPQTNYLTASSLQFGQNFSSTTNCLNAPCATLAPTPIVSGIQGVATNFSWQTACNHLTDATGNLLDVVPYHFVVKVSDNYCQIPKTSYKTITINVRNADVIPATQITCITTAVNGDVTVTWNPIVNTNNSFVAYELYSVQNGLEGTFPIGTTSGVITNPNNDLNLFVRVISGCGGLTARNSDTLKNVHLNLFNPANGTAQLSWNTPAPSPLPGMLPTCTVLREYPTGTWSIIATLPFTQTNYIDTIDICNAFLNYQVIYTTPNCLFNSNLAGDNLDDMMTPDQPIITAASVDTTSGQLVLSWNQNYQPDTYGYVIYLEDANGFLQELDTVWGITTTSYNYTGTISGPLTFTVAAFDSCFTVAVPPTYQTSAKANVHTSFYLTSDLNVCNSNVTLNWTNYEGWGSSAINYTVFVQKNGGTWANVGSTSATTFDVTLDPLANYCITIRATNQAGISAFSNLACFFLNTPAPPAIHYLSVATVQDNTVILRHLIEVGTNTSAVQFERYNELTGLFDILVTLPATSSPITYTDKDVDVQQHSYTYRARIIDSCGGLGSVSNYAKTVLLKVTSDQTLKSNHLEWSSYIDFAGDVMFYEIIRGVDGVYTYPPIATRNPDERYYDDDVSMFETSAGKFCYYIIARESENEFHVAENSFSNQACTAIEPVVYIPNAFTPAGANPLFYPVVSYYDVAEYQFSILDRWGQLIFQSSNPNDAWNGTHQGSNENLPSGTYSYVLTIKNGLNQEYYFRGGVTLLR